MTGDRKRLAHLIFFVIFLVCAFASLVIWFVTRDLGLSGIIATAAAFAATTSAFVDRLFPDAK